MKNGRVATAAVLSCLGICGIGRADPTQDPADPSVSQPVLAYDAPDGCPDRAAFLREWQADRGPAGYSAPELGEGVVRVTLRRSGEGFAAHVVMVDGTGQCGAQRTLSAPSCTELVSDVAASVDLAIRDFTCPPPEPTPVPVAPAPAPCPVPQPRHGELGVAAGLVGFVPHQGRGAPAGGVLLGYHSTRSLWGNEAGPPWSAELELGYVAPPTLPAGVPGSNLDLDLRLARARLSACPVELQVVGALSVPLCAALEAGFVEVDVGGRKQPERFWGALDLAPRLRLSSVTLFAEFEPSVAFPVMRYKIQAGREIMAWISPQAEVRAGVRF